ncbi:hypothetical protein C8N24_0034 [Solirubrobacter pauli]|uniref:VWFA domain-containing protein n=1 Tax=Solirubrobacter pauli TaxID=166793 RepID=A0A660L7J1_9ACTN|nr:VWA domain-containing protein [Solirubrobacter pauli]RKQ90235.1 hypothetical protein C8N24_0034 [Solirubrobacter pauli]
MSTVAGTLLEDFVTALHVGVERRADFLTALRDNPPQDIQRLYWLARVTLVDRLETIPAFDAVFSAYFLGAPPQPSPQRDGESEAPDPQDGGELEPIVMGEGTGKEASVHDLRHRRAYAGGTEDLAELRRALAEHLPKIRSRRRRPHRRGQLDVRRTLRHATRTGEITMLARRGRPHRTRPMLLLIDVSGSLREHTPDYLRFAWAAQCETFTFGTHLTRVTRQLRQRELHTALAEVSAVVEDADGGTRIGPSLHEFVTTPRYADRARGALTIVLSDGLERGAPEQMVAAVHRLAKLSHRLLWWSPLALHPEYRPVTRAMAAIVDDVDLAGARDLKSLLERVREL